MTIASIDIGTNTVLLLIGKADPQAKTISPILNLYRMPRLGKELQPGGDIKSERAEELFEVLTEYRNIITKHRADQVLVTATNAFRIAKNSMNIISKIKDAYGWNVNVISGDTEAEYAYLGAISGRLVSHQRNLVIDIGGGSTEIISGLGTNINYKKSFNTGSVRSTEAYLTNNPPTSDQKKKLDSFLTFTFRELISVPTPTQSIAISGTPTTIACMIKGIKEYDDDIIEGSLLRNEELVKLINEMSTMTSSEIKNRFGPVMKGREDIILAGAIILLKIMGLTKLSKVIVSSRGIRYGAVVSFLN